MHNNLLQKISGRLFYQKKVLFYEKFLNTNMDYGSGYGSEPNMNFFNLNMIGNQGNFSSYII